MTALRTTQVTAFRCRCNRCGYEWTAYEVLPERCAKCKRIGWNAEPGSIKRGRPSGNAKPGRPPKGKGKS